VNSLAEIPGFHDLPTRSRNEGTALGMHAPS
jgi:hypothetical protein